MQSEPISQEPTPQIQPPGEIPALPAPRKDTQPSGDRWPRVLGCMLRMVLVVLLAAALAVAVYFGWPVVYARYVLPVQNNTTRIAAVETHQQAGQEQLSAMATAQSAALAAQEATLSARIAALESAGKAGDQALATAQAAQSGQAAALATLAPRIHTLEGDIKEMSVSLAGLQSTQEALQSTQGALQAGDASGRAELDRQVGLLKSMEMLSRARLFLYESNFGLAKQDILVARDLLATLPDQPNDPDLAEVVRHLEQAIARLPDFPVAASDDLDTAWQLLLGGQPQPGASETTPTPTETPGVTPTPTK